MASEAPAVAEPISEVVAAPASEAAVEASHEATAVTERSAEAEAVAEVVEEAMTETVEKPVSEDVAEKDVAVAEAEEQPTSSEAVVDVGPDAAAEAKPEAAAENGSEAGDEVMAEVVEEQPANELKPEAAAEAATNEFPTTLKGKCDLCSKPDGYGGHNLQKCKDCGLLVHELCYATIPTTTKNPTFTCHACASIGKSVQVNIPSKPGGPGNKKPHRESMTQSSRPTECAFCSVKTGIHAMHPLFDMHGSEGRQLVLPASGVGFKRIEKRLAWVHSLCAQFICQRGGVVYGLYDGGKWEGDDGEHEQKYEIGVEVSKEFESGVFCGKVVEYHKKEGLYTVRYEDGDEEDLEEDELEEVLASRKKSKTEETAESADDKDKDKDNNNNDDGLVATESFCIATGKGYDETVEALRQLKCTICESTDKNSLRIPLQCRAWDKDEFPEFRKCHKKGKYDRKKPLCALAMHVGCSRWATSKYAGVKGKTLRMCYYYPGQTPGFEGEELYKEPVSDMFCRTHAREVMERMKDVVKNMRNGEEEEEETDEEEKVAKVISEKRKKNKFLEESDEDD